MSNVNSTVRFCKKCQVETEHNKRGDCKPCAKAYSAAWCQAHKEKLAARSLAWGKANPEKVRATAAAWRKANPEKYKARCVANYAANKDRLKITSSAWQKANPEICRIHNQNRKAKKRANGGTLSRGLSAKLFKLQKGRCACCGLPLGDNYHLDHIMPIDLGGPNVDDNMQLLRPTCNHQKHAKHPIDFMQERGFLL